MKLIVTGAGGALGAATAALLERQGHEVARIVRNSASLDSRTIACDDLADTQAAEQSVGAAVEALGGLEGVLHLGGAFEWTPVAASDAALWQTLFRKNLETTLNVVKAALPCLEAGGAIVMIGAAAAEPSGHGALRRVQVRRCATDPGPRCGTGRESHPHQYTAPPPSSTRRPIAPPCLMPIQRTGRIPTPSRMWLPSWCRLPPAPSTAP